MSRQINLVNPALRKTRDRLSALPVAIATAVVLATVAIGGVWARVSAATHHRDAEALVASQKQAQEALLAATQQFAARKPDATLAAELEQTQAVAKRQREILDTLDSGAVGDTKGFSEYLRGFARQVPQGLWLTGFSIGAGGRDMEVRGRMLSPPLLTEYVRRLNAESAFRGQSFAALQIQVPHAEGAAAGAAARPAYTEFVLSTVPPEATR